LLGRGFESRWGHGCLSVVFLCCVVLCRYRPLRRAYHSSRGVLAYVSIVCDQENLNGWGKTQQWGKSWGKKLILVQENKSPINANRNVVNRSE
jgi:hypothetical protein